MRPLVRINIPSWMRSNMLLKEASFDIPATDDGYDFLGWWDQAPKREKDSVIKLAHEQGVPLIDALKGYLASKLPPDLG